MKITREFRHEPDDQGSVLRFWSDRNVLELDTATWTEMGRPEAFTVTFEG